MKLSTARISNFKCIEDSGKVDMGDVTCLVGKNESGKTAFLHALERLNPAPDRPKNYETLEYPRKRWVEYKRRHDNNPATVVEAEFMLHDEELAQIETEFGKGVIPASKVTVSKGYDNELNWQFQFDESIAVKHTLNLADLPEPILGSCLECSSHAELIELIRDLEDKPPSVDEFEGQLNAKFSKPLEARIVDEFLVRYLPTFIYFADYSVMKGQISVEYLERKLGSNQQLTESELTFMSLLGMVGATPGDLRQETQYERLKAELEAASINITDEVFAFWSQNKNLEVEFDLSAANPADEAPLNSGTILHVRVKNKRHRVSVPFDERSKGFVWFFSFLVYFSELELGDSDLVLLLDEPGLSLHAKAQGDFLRFIEDRLAPRHQVIYSTHSPFMIDATKLDRVRTVQDSVEKGTVISSEVLRVDQDTVFPLQAALGYELAQTLFLGPNALLVEGPSDMIYLEAMSELAQDADLSGLDPRWVVVPVGGADKIYSFVSLLGANQLNVAVIMDVDVREQQRVSNLIRNGFLELSKVIPLTDIVHKKSADMEDVLGENLYLGIVSGAYRSQLGQPLTLNDLGKGSGRIVTRVERYFQDHGLSFSHFKPARYFANNLDSFSQTVDEQTKKRIGSLFSRVNALLD